MTRLIDAAAVGLLIVMTAQGLSVAAQVALAPLPGCDGFPSECTAFSQQEGNK